MEIPALKMEKRTGIFVSPSDLMRIMDEPSGSQVTSTYNLIFLQQSCTGRICPEKKEFRLPIICPVVYIPATKKVTDKVTDLPPICGKLSVLRNIKNQIQIQCSTTGQCLHCAGSFY